MPGCIGWHGILCDKVYMYVRTRLREIIWHNMGICCQKHIGFIVHLTVIWSETFAIANCFIIPLFYYTTPCGLQHTVWEAVVKKIFSEKGETTYSQILAHESLFATSMQEMRLYHLFLRLPSSSLFYFSIIYFHFTICLCMLSNPV